MEIKSKDNNHEYDIVNINCVISNFMGDTKDEKGVYLNYDGTKSHQILKYYSSTELISDVFTKVTNQFNASIKISSVNKGKEIHGMYCASVHLKSNPSFDNKIYYAHNNNGKYTQNELMLVLVHSILQDLSNNNYKCSTNNCYRNE